MITFVLLCMNAQDKEDRKVQKSKINVQAVVTHLAINTKIIVILATILSHKYKVE